MKEIFESNNLKPVLLLGKLSSLVITVSGMGYFALMVTLLMTGNFKLPPPEFAQNIAAIVDLVISPLIIVLISSLFYMVQEGRRIFVMLGLIFSSLFTVVVCINRICQLTIVAQSIASGKTDGLKWFLPYEPTSVMFALELTGFSFFLSIALFFVAIALSGISQRSIKIALLVYSLLGLISFIGFLFNSIIVNVGFVAWGLVLYIATWLLYNYFSKQYRLYKLN